MSWDRGGKDDHSLAATEELREIDGDDKSFTTIHGKQGTEGRPATYAGSPGVIKFDLSGKANQGQGTLGGDDRSAVSNMTAADSLDGLSKGELIAMLRQACVSSKKKEGSAPNETDSRRQNEASISEESLPNSDSSSALYSSGESAGHHSGAHGG